MSICYSFFLFSSLLFRSDLQMDTMDFVEVSIPSQYHRHIIGRGGANSECSPLGFLVRGHTSIHAISNLSECSQPLDGTSFKF